jgi:DNA-binding NtrC family response regulator
LCDGGTVVLEDLPEAGREVQERLVRAIDQGQVQRPGEANPRAADVRFIATLAKPLPHERLLPELADRFGFTIVLPPLRDRIGDVEILATSALAVIADGLGRPAPVLEADALSVLLRHPWPGNVRQLRQALERAVVAADGGHIRARDLPDTIRTPAADVEGQPPLLTLAEVERQHILHVLERLGGNKKAAAESLGIDRSTLYAKLKTYGVHDR